MRYNEYVSRNWKGMVLKVLGLCMLFTGPVITLWTIVGKADNSIIINPLSLILMFVGLTVFVIGHFDLSKLDYEREQTGTRMYHYKGKY